MVHARRLLPVRLRRAGTRLGIFGGGLVEGYEALIPNGGTDEAPAVPRRNLPRKPGHGVDPASIPMRGVQLVAATSAPAAHETHRKMYDDVSLDQMRKGMVEAGLLTPPFDTTQLTTT